MKADVPQAIRILVPCLRRMEWVKRIIGEVEPLEDSLYGAQYRCSLTLNDGTFLPCVVLHSKDRLVELAKRRISEEMGGRGHLGGDDPYGKVVALFVARGNRVNDVDVASASPSRFAIPLPLMRQIHGETTMGWTAWVFRMRDGRRFSYGTSFHREFFHLPDGYEFTDVEEVINHSFVDAQDATVPLERGARLPASYPRDSVLRERTSFSCAVDWI
jgi:hypothetical protein